MDNQFREQARKRSIQEYKNIGAKARIWVKVSARIVGGFPAASECFKIKWC